MELELKQKEMAGYKAALETTLFSEETLECIVPDSCPDILRIVDCDGIVCIQSRETDEGRAEVRGKVKMSVLYLPDGETGVRHLDVMIPFSCGTEHTEIKKDSTLHTIPGIRMADARLLNPRKIYLRTEIALEVQVYTPSIRLMTEGCACDFDLGLQEKKEIYRSMEVTSVQEKNFTYNDEILLPASKPDVEELLRVRAEIGCGERKVIGSKLILKGQVLLKLLYRSIHNEVCSAEFELPFSQILELTKAEEDGNSEVTLSFQEINCQLVEEDARKIAVELRILAQAVVQEEQVTEILTDLYSTAYQTTVDRNEELLSEVCGGGNRRVSVREVLETSIAVKSVADFWVHIDDVNRKREGAAETFTAVVQAFVLCFGEDDELYSVKQTFRIECQVNTENSTCCRCQCPGELYAVPTSGGIELRFPLDFEYRTKAVQTVAQVSAAQLDHSQPADLSKRPSIVLKRMEKGETLWELAKAFSTTKADIMSANELTEEIPLVGKLLLIPKKR